MNNDVWAELAELAWSHRLRKEIDSFVYIAFDDVWEFEYRQMMLAGFGLSSI